MTDAQIKHMVDRFLAWRLPESFCPDGGITFTKLGNADTAYEYKYEPVGTNLFTATEAEAMVRHMLDGLPSEKVETDLRDDSSAFDGADWYWRTMDPDDAADTPEEAIHRSMLGTFCVCEIASSFSGPTRYAFIARLPDSDEEELRHFATREEAIAACREAHALITKAV